MPLSEHPALEHFRRQVAPLKPTLMVTRSKAKANPYGFTTVNGYAETVPMEVDPTATLVESEPSVA
jgi:hypothetical protein